MKSNSAAKTKGVEPTLFFGGIEQGWHIASTHCSVIGETGSGKTATIRMLMKPVLQRVGQGVRVIIFDPKSQFIPVVAGLAPEVPIDIAHCGDQRCVGWDIAADCRTLKACRSVAHILFPVNPQNKDPFFATASRTLFTAILRAFVASKVDWSFRDAVIAMRHVDTLRSVLSRTADGRRMIGLYFGVRSTLLNIMSSIGNDIDPYLEVAAAWDAAKNKISIRQWCKQKEDRVLVLGHDDENESTSKALNQCLFQRLKQSLLTPPFIDGRETWLFLDEITLAGLPPKALLRLADLGRELGVRLVLAAQGLDGAIEEYGERLTFALFGGCVNQAMLRTSSNRTAEFFSKQMGKYEAIELQRSTSYGPGGNSRSESEQKVVRDAVMPSEFQTLPVASRRYGFDGFYLGELGAWKGHISPAEIKERIGQSDSTVPAFVPHDNEPTLRDWDEADLKRLGLPIELIDDSASVDIDEEEGATQERGSPNEITQSKSNKPSKPSVWNKLKSLVAKHDKATKPAKGQQIDHAKQNDKKTLE